MAVFDLLAPAYDRFMRFWKLYHDREIDLVLHTSDQSKLVDLGGGNGHHATRLAKKCAEVVVVDISEKMLKQIPPLNNVTPVHADIAHTGLPSDAFDKVLISDVLHHLPDPSSAIKEAARILAPGGQIVIHDFNPSHLVTKLLGAFENSVIERVAYLSTDDIIAMLRTHGFVDIHTIVKSYFYVISATKESG